MITIREATETDTLDSFALWSEENDGDTIEVAESEGTIVGFVQRTGAYIYMIESVEKGVGHALVEHIKEAQGDWLQACNVSTGCAGFWIKMGFEKSAATGERPGEYHYEWYREDA